MVGDNKILDVKGLSELVYYSLKELVVDIAKASSVKMCTIGYSDLNVIPDSRRYSLSGKVILGGLERGVDATIVGFGPGDGTGQPTKYDPRPKKGVAEIFLPVGTLYNNQFIPRLTHLTQIGVSETSQHLGSSEIWYNAIIKSVNTKDASESSIKFEYFPLDFTYFEKEFGNPHAIKFDKWSADNISQSHQNWIQFGAFIEFYQHDTQLDMLRKFSGEQTPWISHYTVKSK